MSETQTSDPNAPKTEEVSLSDELTVYAAIAGITLSHNSIPLVGTTNPLNGTIVLLSVGLVISILFAHIDNRFSTEEIGLSTARTLTVLISVYLIGNGVHGLFSYTRLNLSGNFQSVTTFLILVVIYLLLFVRRLRISGLDDYRVGRHYESEGNWTNKGRNKANLTKGLIMSSPLTYFVIREPAVTTVPLIFGFLSAIMMVGIWGTVFLRSEMLENVERKKGDARIIFPSCVMIFLVLFAGVAPPW